MAEKNKRLEKNFLVQGSILAVAGIITKLIGIIYRVPMQNIVGDEGMGYYNAAFSIYSIALMLTSYSLPLAVSKLVSARVALGQYKNAYKVFRGAIAFAIIAGGVVSLLLFFGAGGIADSIMKMDMSAYALRVLAPCIFIVALLGVIRGFFQGIGSMVPTAISQLIEQVVNAVASIGGAVLLLRIGKAKADKSFEAAYGAAGGTLGTVIGAFAALLFVALIFLAYKKLFKRQMRRDQTRNRENYKKIFKILMITIGPVILSATVYNVSDFLDSAIFGQIMSAQGFKKAEYAALLGMFGSKYNTLINVPLSISSALAASLIPTLVSTLQTGNRKQIHSKIDMVTRFNMMVAIPCTVGFIVLAKPLLDLLFFTSDNTKAAYMLQLGAISVVFFCLSTVTNSILQGLDDMMTPVKSAAISLVIHVIALFLMMVVFKWNIYAVVLSKIVFSGSICILNAHALRNRIGYIQEQKKTFIIPTIAAAIMGVLSLIVRLIFELFIGAKIATIIALLIAVVAYGVMLIVLGGLTEEELLSMPKGTKIVSICRKIHIIRGEYK